MLALVVVLQRRLLWRATRRSRARVGIERRLMCVRDGDVPAPQHLAVRRRKRDRGVLQAPHSDMGQRLEPPSAVYHVNSRRGGSPPGLRRGGKGGRSTGLAGSPGALL